MNAQLDKKRLLIKLTAVKWWQLLLYICVALILVLFIIELSFDLDEKTLQLIGITDLLIWIIFVTDLAYHYITAEDKGVFFRHNWLLILSLVPITSILKSLRSFESLKALKLFEFGAKAEKMGAKGLEQLQPRLEAAYASGLITSISPAFRTVKGGQMVAHWKHEKFFIRLRDIKIHSYISPGVNRKVADGIMGGIDLFVKRKLRLKPVYKELRNFNELRNRKDSYLDIFITKNALSTSSVDNTGKLRGTVVFATSPLADLRNYRDSKANLDYLKKLRGTIFAYNKLAKLFNYEACNNEHCAFNYNKEDFDTVAFLYHLNKEIPLCEKHSKWKY